MTMSEKSQLPYITPVEDAIPSPRRRSFVPFLVLGSILLVLGYHSKVFDISPFTHHCHGHPKYTTADIAAASCPAQPPALNVGSNWDPLTDSAYASLAANRLSKSVQINTVSFDDLPANASDSRFDKHYVFSHFLETEFPKLFNQPMKHEYINVHGHLFTWQGSNPDLKPMVLMAHTDTVPVLEATLGKWTYPPFEGTLSHDATPDTPGTWVWGRGSSDCKNSLLGIFGALERLVTEEFEPKRTILVANGFDEEIGGVRGAEQLAKTIQDRYGPDSISFVIDEGFSGISYEYGATIAALGMAEKGSVNIKITVETLGGHSSVPPAHTSIGIMSLSLAELEAHPFTPELDPHGPYLKYLSCLSDLAPDVPKSLKKQVKDPKKWPQLAKDLAASERVLNSYLATSQAIDLINGGVKVNALPEYVEATVNYRISFTSSVNETLTHVQEVLEPLAHSINFTISSFDGSPKSSNSHITLAQDNRKAFEPAPITSGDSPSFKLMAGTCKTVFGEDTIVAPTGMFANTDTRHFWNLTSNLYRFTPALVVENLNQHTVNERISLAGHLNTTRFYYKLIHNSIGWDE